MLSRRVHRALDELRADLRDAWRSVKGSPGASTVAVVILGAAIGVNVILFAFIDAYALRPLPIAGAERYVDVRETDDRGGRSTRWTRDELAALDGAVAPAFEGLYASTSFELPMLEPSARLVHGEAVSARYFPLLRARFALGRPFGAENDGADEPVAVLSHVGWRRLLDADANAVGRKIRLGDTWLTVIGVTVPEFRGVEAVTPEMWIPLRIHAALAAGPGDTGRYHLSGLLREGATPAQVAVLGAPVLAGFDRSALPAGGARRLLVEHRGSFFSAERGELARLAGLVLGAFALVLLIACANLASLHVARACARHRDIATRFALGASRGRLIRQLLTESLLLSGLGAALGGALAVGGADWVQGRLFSIVTEAGMTLAPIEVRGRVLAFGALLGVIAGLAFGLLPALEGTSMDLVSGSRRDGLALGGRVRPQRLGGFLVTVQVTASLVLLVLASLLLRNVQAATRLDAGYDLGRLVDLRFPRPTAAVLERIRRDPRVVSASVVAHTPLSGTLPRQAMIVDGATHTLRYNLVDEAYFATLGLRPTEGRSFRADETASSAPVVVVSAATARRLWPGQSALGRVIEVNEPGAARGRHEVIGVAPDVVSGFFIEGRDPSAVYFPAVASSRAAEVLVRPRDEAVAAVIGLRGLCQEIDSAVLCEPKTLKELVVLQRFPFLAASVVASGLGSIAIALTTIGLYGIVAFAVVQRLREIGVRIALGATPGAVLRLLLGRAARSVALGLALGLPFCVLLCRLAARLFRLEAFDPVILPGVPLLLAAVALTAALIPARRATGIEPAVTLRADA